MENLGRNGANELMALENINSAESHTVFLHHITTFAFLVANEEFRAEDYRSFKQSQEGLLGDRLFRKQGSKTFAEDQQSNQDAKLLVPREKTQLKLGGLSSPVQFLSRMAQACSLHAASGSVQPSYHVPSALGRSTSHHKLRDAQREAPLGPAEQQARFLGTVCVRIGSPGQLAQRWFSA